MHPLSVGVVLVAAGSGQRFGNADKVLVPVAGKPLLCHSLDVFASISQVVQIVIVAGEHSRARIEQIAVQHPFHSLSVVLGGETRQASVRNGVQAISRDADLLAIHDAARPLVDTALVERVIASAATTGAAVPVMPVSDTVYRVDVAGKATGVEPRETLRAAQTPQIARRDWMLTALHADGTFTDEGSALLLSGYPVQTVEGSAENMKVTWPEDVQWVDRLLANRASS